MSKTAVIRDAGANAIFGPPWAPDEGLMRVKVPMGTSMLIVRAMDYDWCKKDDLLGEVVINISDHLGKPFVDVPLLFKGKQTKSTIQLSIHRIPNQGQRALDGTPVDEYQIQIFKALNLRSGDFLGKNDVYVQVYAVPAGMVPILSQPLPIPVEETFIPAGMHQIPFEFHLPRDLPSSMVSAQGDDYIAYSVYSNIDVAWKVDPSTRTFFTVMQHLPAALYITPAEFSNPNSFVHNSILCCPCGNLGRLTLKLSLPRSSYAPGEIANVRIEVISEWIEFNAQWKSLAISFNQTVSCWAEGRRDGYIRALVMPIFITNTSSNTSPMGAASGLVQDVPVQIPLTPPSYAGGLGQNSAWLGEVSRYGGRWARASHDPVTWSYSIVCRLTLTPPGLPCADSVYVLSLPIGVTAVNQPAFQAIQAGKNIFAAVNRPAVTQVGASYPPGVSYAGTAATMPMPMAMNRGGEVQQSPNQWGQGTGVVLANSTPYAQQVQGNQFQQSTPYPVQSSTPVIVGAPYQSPQTPAMPLSYGAQVHPSSQPVVYAVPANGVMTTPYSTATTNTSDAAYNYAATPAPQGQSFATPTTASSPPTNPSNEVHAAPHSGGYNPDDYRHTEEANPNFKGIELVPSATSKIIRDAEEDYTVQNELELMYCPLYFKMQ